MSTRFHTPLRYPGGKARLGPWIAWTMRHNGISGGTYVEPYAGGAGAALYLLLNRYVNKIVINDIDPAINSFWRSITGKPEQFIDKVKNTPITLEEREKQIAVIKSSDQQSELDLGFAAFFLNRVNRSGIISGGVIGGMNQQGKYKIDARYNKEALVERISKIAKYSDRIKVCSSDAMTLLDELKQDLTSDSLIYLDPPYYNKASQLYQNYYKPEDHQNVSERIKRLETPWLVTYDNCSEIASLYEDKETCEFSLTYSTSNTRPVATELMIFDYVNLPSKPFLYRSTRPYPSTWQ